LTNRLLTAETPLSYSDLERLHLTRRSEQHAQRVIPPWTYSREAIQKVILEKLKRYTRYIGGCEQAEVNNATDLPALDALARKSQRHLRRSCKPRLAKAFHVAEHLSSVKTRSLAALWVSELYMAYRLGRNSVDIASVLKISPWAVRQHLFRLNQVAKIVCPELCATSRNFGGVYSRETYLDAKIAEAERKAERASKSKKCCRLVPVYQGKLAELRKMKAAREAERREATVFSSANRAAA
jgi:hypothetical protein